jgi:signal peptidase II
MRLLWVSLGIVVLDQLSKIIVVQTMYLNQSIPVIGDWLLFTYTWNPGMAFGIRFGAPWLISAFSIIATFVILGYIFSVRRGYAPYRMSLGLVFGGAVGNIVDRVLYGPVFQGGEFFQGSVVDFIHVNLWRGHLPETIPLIGGKYIALFPIWNVADMAIVLGVVGILLFQKGFHARMVDHRAGDAALPEAESELDHLALMSEAVQASTVAASSVGGSGTADGQSVADVEGPIRNTGAVDTP